MRIAMTRAERCILRAMIHKQAWLIRRMRRYELSRVKLTGKRLQRWINRHHKRPLSMLGECYGKQCPNTRIRHPHKRKLWEDSVICAIRKAYGNNIARLQCILFGSGGLFQEVVMLSKLCSALTIDILEVMCCDAEYATSSLDEKAIIEARFNQAAEWMWLVAPRTQWLWAKTHNLDHVALSPIPTIFAAADMSISAEIAQSLHTFAQAIAPAQLLPVILDEQGKIQYSLP